MRGAAALATCIGFAGCSQLFGLEGPARPDARVDGAIVDDAPIDTTADAPTDTAPLVCPGTYGLTFASTMSKYRLIVTTAVFTTHHADCNDDLAGATHLASLDTQAEINDAVALVGGVITYIGAAQAPDQIAPNVGWYTFNGAPLPASWDTGQPLDAPTAGEQNEENLATVAANLRDATGDTGYQALCECDGKPIDATVAGYLP